MFSLARTNGGVLMAWGDNGTGQLGDGSIVVHAAPVVALGGARAIAIGSGFTAAIKDDDTLWTWGNNASGQLGDGSFTTRSTPAQVLAAVKAATTTSLHILAIRTD